MIKTNDNNQNRNYELCQHNNIWFHKKLESENWCLVIPEIIRTSLIRMEHERLGHSGVYKTICGLK